MRLGVLDIQHPRWAVELAPDVERLGYSRYWLGEHHGTDQSGSPEVLTGIIAAITRYIRVGPAGVLLRYYSPFKVAQSHRLLAEIFSPRIDLGVARGLGGDAAVAEALLDGRSTSTEIYDAKVRELAQLLQGSPPDGHPPGRAPCAEHAVSARDFWVLGTTRHAALLAASVGAAFAFSDYLARMSNPDVDGPAIVRTYRDAFAASPALPAPRWNVAIAGAAIADGADRIVTLPLAGPPPLVGTVDTWRQRLREVSERYESDELMMLDVCDVLADKRLSYSLLAEAAELAVPV